MLRYVIYMDNSVLAVRFHYRRQELVVGGNKFFTNQMKDVSVIFFKRKARTLRLVHTQKNKARYISEIGLEMFQKGIEAMRKAHITVQQVKSLGTIMR